jgi:hypothetical protein
LQTIIVMDSGMPATIGVLRDAVSDHPRPLAEFHPIWRRRQDNPVLLVFR